MIKPFKDLNTFDGKIKIQDPDGGPANSIMLSRNQFLHKGATLRNSDRVLGLVVYTGVETKLALNLSKYRFKMSQLEKDTNWTIFGNLVIMLTFSLILAFCNYGWAVNHQDH